MDKPILFRGRVAVSVPRDVDVRALRKRLGMSQNLFAARFGFPLATLRHWEYGRRKPSGASLALLNVIDANPGVVLRALRAPPLETPSAIAADPRAACVIDPDQVTWEPMERGPAHRWIIGTPPAGSKKSPRRRSPKRAFPKK